MRCAPVLVPPRDAQMPATHAEAPSLDGAVGSRDMLSFACRLNVAQPVCLIAAHLKTSLPQAQPSRYLPREFITVQQSGCPF